MFFLLLSITQCQNVILLIHHGYWNRLKNPFLLCDCDRSFGVRKNETRKCNIIFDKDHLIYYNGSKTCWLRKKKDVKYKDKQHCEWISVAYKGIFYEGIHPLLLPRSSIRLNVFHTGCAVGKRLMSYLRTMFLKQSVPLQNKFLTLICKFWPEGLHFLLYYEKPFSQLKGDEVKKSFWMKMY